MRTTTLAIVLIISLYIKPNIAVSQENLELLNTLKTNFRQVTQQQIDTFLKSDKKTITSLHLADYYHHIGKWYYFVSPKNTTNSHLKNAIYYTNKAIDLKKTLDSVTPFSLKQSWYNLGFYKKRNLDNYGAIKAYISSTTIGKPDNLTEYAYEELSSIYNKLGDFHKALDNLKNAIYTNISLDLSKEKLINNYIRIALTYTRLGYKKHTSDIKKNLLKADSIISSINTSKDDFLIQKIQIYHTEGNRLHEIGDFKNAVKSFKKIEESSKKANIPSILANIYNSLGYSFLNLNNPTKAEAYLQKAIFTDTTYSAPHENLGDVYLEKKDFNKALNYYQKAIALSVNNLQLTNYKEPLTQEYLELAKEKLNLLNHLTTKAKGLIAFYKHDGNKTHLQLALKTFLSADKLVDIIRLESTEFQSKLFWRKKSASLYMKAVEVCYLLNKPKDAYYFMERNKALLLLENITAEQAKTIAKLPDSIAKREFVLKQNIYLSENKLHQITQTQKDSIIKYRNLVFLTKQRYNKFTDSLKIAYPDYSKIKKTTHVLPYSKFKNHYCTNDYAVLQYILNDAQGYGLLTTNHETLFYPLKNINSLNTTIASFYNLLTKKENTTNKKEQLNNWSHTIFKTLIPSNVHALIKNKKLTIIPDYTLQQIPFETFAVNTNTERYLIEDTDIHYAYSMSYLSIKEKIVTTASKNWLGYAPVSFDTQKLPKLVFSKPEITETNKLQNGTMALHKNATKRNWLNQMPNYKINHLSTHADVDSTGNHWIAFNDAKLFLNEIYATKNQSDLVVLSACNTSSGELKKGEGVMSLARGFFHAGAKSVISSLWYIDDKSGKDIIVDFYKGLNKGQTKSVALRNAKLNYINTYRGTKISPSYWGSLILIGDNSPLKTSIFTTHFVLLIILSLLCLLLVFIFFKKKAQNK